MKELEGKIITWEGDNGEEHSALIVGCDRDIGITIVNAEDKNDYFYCLSGPSSPHYPSDPTTPENIEEDKLMFDSVVKMLKKGYFNYKELAGEPITILNRNPSIETCSFA